MGEGHIEGGTVGMREAELGPTVILDSSLHMMAHQRLFQSAWATSRGSLKSNRPIGAAGEP